MLTITNYDYTGGEQTFTANLTGKYKLEVWGAQGGSTYAENNFGGYVKGVINLTKETNLYIYIGGQGLQDRKTTFNGGGSGGNSNFTNFSSSEYGYNTYGSSGGGATDIRYFTTTPSSSDLAWDSTLGLNSRIMVAGAGGGTSGVSLYGYGETSAAGGLTAYSGTYYQGHGDVGQYGKGGTQISGGAAGNNIYNAEGINNPGSFGVGGSCNSTSDQSGAGGGGAGYYGGGSGGSTLSLGYGQGAGGGSSYISGHTGCVAITSATNQSPKSGCTTGTTNNECSKHYSGLVFTDTKMIDGAGYSWTNVKGSLEQMPKPSGGYYTSGTGHTGNGYARITYIGS